MKYRVGTRGSKLALAQTEWVCDRLRQAYPEHTFEVCVIATKGDKILDKPLHEIGDKGLFVTEIEEQIRNGNIHIGVHSMKDMPGAVADGLVFTKTWQREDARDVLILREAASLEELPEGAVIATGSVRREVQLKSLRPDIQVVGIRGNVDTRLRKMEEQKLDGIVLAAAGLHRLGMKQRITQYLEPKQMVPAPAQGALALEVREDQTKLIQMLDALSDRVAEKTVQTERAFLQETDGNCHVPIGAYCEMEETGELCLRALFGNADGTQLECVVCRGTEPEEVAREAFAWIQRER